MEWQPIETAPCEQDVLVFCDDGISIAMQARGLLGAKRKWFDANSWSIHPTHWMPLPNPPKD